MASHVRFASLLVPPFIVALWLRLYGTGEQILTGDELHVLKVALAWSPSEIVRTWTDVASVGHAVAIAVHAIVEARANVAAIRHTITRAH